MINNDRNQKMNANGNEPTRPDVLHEPGNGPKPGGQGPGDEQREKHPPYEVPSKPPVREIPEKPSRDVPQPDRERAENEGMIAPPAEGTNPTEKRRFNETPPTPLGVSTAKR